MKMLSVRLPEELAQTIKIHAAVSKTTTQDLICKALGQYVESNPLPETAASEARRLYQAEKLLKKLGYVEDADGGWSQPRKARAVKKAPKERS
jgi:hypothetical protein